MPAAAAIVPAVIGGAASLFGASKQAKASKEAAQIQSAAAAQAANLATTAGNAAGDTVQGTGNEVAAGVQGATEAAQQGVTQAGGQAQQKVGMSTEAANALLKQIYGETTGGLNDYKATGGQAISALNAGIGDGGEFNRKFGPEDMQIDPGYAFRLEQGQKALEESAAARGGSLGGGALKSLAGYSQGLASQEYQNAFNRFRTQQQDRFSNLNTLAQTGLSATNSGINAGENYAGRSSGNTMTGGLTEAEIAQRAAATAGQFGVTGATTAGGFRLNAANTAGGFRLEGTRQATEALTGGANARAAGTVGSANAWQGGLQGVASAAAGAGGYFQLRNILNPKPKMSTGGDF